MKEQFSTPVLLIGYNRPDTTRMVFERIKQVKPKYLYFAVDAPKDLGGVIPMIINVLKK